MGNCSVDYPGPSPLTFPAPPVKRSRHRLLDTISAHFNSVKQMKINPRSSAVDYNVNNIAVHGPSENADLISKSAVTCHSVSTGSRGQFDSSHRGSEETGLNDTSNASSRPLDSRLQVLWTGQVAVNGTNICSAELLSRCHIRHTL